MSRQSFDTIDILRLEVENTPVGQVNRIQNTDGVFGGWGWLTPIANVTLGSDPVSAWQLRLTTAVTQQGVYVVSEAVPCAPGQYVGGRIDWQTRSTANESVFFNLQWLDAAGVPFASAGAGGEHTTLGTKYAAASLAPAGTAYVRLQVTIKSADAPVVVPPRAIAGRWVSWNKSMLAIGATAGEVTAFPYVSNPQGWTDILGVSHTIKINREELNLGILSAEVLSANLAPSVSTLVRPGKRIRCMALRADTGAWEPIFTGKILNGTVKFDPRRKATDDKRARITLTAVDPISQLAQLPRPNGVSLISELPAVLEGAQVPWRVNGSDSQVNSAAIVASNENAYAIDQVAITRDSRLGFAWMDRFGVLQAWSSSTIPAGVVGRRIIRRNLVAGDAAGSALVAQGAGATLASAVSYAGKSWRRVSTSTTMHGARVNVALASLVDGAPYRYSLLVANDGASAVGVVVNWCGLFSVTYVIDPGEQRRVATGGAVADYTAAIRYAELLLPGAGTNVLVREILIEAGETEHVVSEVSPTVPATV